MVNTKTSEKVRTSLLPLWAGWLFGYPKRVRSQRVSHELAAQTSLFDQRNWGLIIYDEVHLLPAPVFQVTAGLQASGRLGLTATLVREGDVFALIGPKKVDVPWKVLEGEGWIATATCTEIRLPLPEEMRMPYAVADAQQKFRVASENPAKLAAVREILKQHPGEPT